MGARAWRLLLLGLLVAVSGMALTGPAQAGDRFELKRLARNDPKSQMRASCRRSADGRLAVTFKTRGKRSLRRVVGKKLRLTVARPKTAAPPAKGEKMAITATFSGKAKRS